MFALVSGIAPAKTVRTAAAPFLITALAICQAGCASDSNVYYAKSRGCRLCREGADGRR